VWPEEGQQACERGRGHHDVERAWPRAVVGRVWVRAVRVGMNVGEMEGGEACRTYRCGRRGCRWIGGRWLNLRWRLRRGRRKGGAGRPEKARLRQ
jgi:hypothetical protein